MFDFPQVANDTQTDYRYTRKLSEGTKSLYQKNKCKIQNNLQLIHPSFSTPIKLAQTFTELSETMFINTLFIDLTVNMSSKFHHK